MHPVCINEQERIQELFTEDYSQTLDLAASNLRLLQQVKDLFKGTGEEMNFNAGLQIGALLERNRTNTG